MSRRFLVQNTAIAAIIALVATVMAASPVVGQVGDTVGGAASDDAAFAEPGEAVDIDVVANDDGMDEFDEAPVLLVVDQPDGGLLSTAFDEDGIAVLLFSANVAFGGVTTGKYRACWGNSCDNAEVTVYVGGEACTIVGTSGPDTLTGTSGDDVICGLSGRDTIDGRGGDDLIFGGNGRDTLRGSGGADEIYGGRGDDTIIGGNGADRLFGRKGADTISGNGGADEIHGNRGPDTISGGNGNDALFGGRGRDTITGGDGEDLIRGRRGDDDLRGNANADQIFGGRGDDSIRGNAGADVLDGGRGTDTINGGNGEDTCTRGETVSNCEDEPVEPGVDTDGDGIPDDEDPDDDNDGTPDDQDAFPLDPTETTDTDGDGAGDNTDPDIDGDGVLNDDDAFPLDPTEDTDTDGDGTGNNADLDDDDDTFADVDDAFPLDPLEWLDTDGDGTGNNADLDDDGDGVPDVDDPDPLDPTVPDQTDTDGDGVPDSQDPDIDGDGIPNELDDFPTDAGERFDTDGDGIGDASDTDIDDDGFLNDADAFPFDPAEAADTDIDGLGNNADLDDDEDLFLDDQDAFPLDPTESTDTDGDGTGDNADTDDDNDGVEDVDDAFPTDPTETLDTDFDGIGNNADPDDDNDGVLDVDDAFPLDSLVSKDTDGDGIGDRLDDDNDNDGAPDLFDSFPNDPNEQLDTDLDGTGNNADTDDDDDTFADTNDAFPLDPDEWVDANGNGIGDNADDQADLDGDGQPDTADTDIDGDRFVNEEDAFPRDSSEWRDADGDGVGDNADTDDDDDGVPDVADLFPSDSGRGGDADGDGTPDEYDLDPESAEEPRFEVRVEGESGAAARIVSEGLILEDEVTVTFAESATDEAISGLAASDIVDFSIDGPLTEFESARISIPIDPVLAQQQDSVEVFWLNEEYDLWVPDGVDLTIDPDAATVSVTVDHFSKFIALRKGANPFVVPPSTVPSECIDTGVDVLMLIDDSGSNDFGYIINGVLVEASDPDVSTNPNDATSRQRLLAARDILDGLNPDTDRVAVGAFTNDVVTPLPDLDFIGDGTSGELPALAAVQQIVSTPGGEGTDIVASLRSAAALFDNGSQARAKAIVIITDGGTDGFSFGEVRDAVGDTIVHVVGVGNANSALSTVAQAGGGVFASNRTSLDFPVLLQRLNELNTDGGSNKDFDGDLLSDCDERRGMMTPDAIVLDGDLVFRPGDWVQTNPENVDSDGDLLWDSEELISLDLRDNPGLANFYRPVIDEGFPFVFVERGNPNNSSIPVSALGDAEPGFVPSLGSAALDGARQLRVAAIGLEQSSILEVNPLLNGAGGTRYADLSAELISLDWLLRDLTPPLQEEDFDEPILVPTMSQGERFLRLTALYDPAGAIANDDRFLDRVEVPILTRLRAIDDARANLDTDPTKLRGLEVERDTLMKQLADHLLPRSSTGSGVGISNYEEFRDAVTALQATYFLNNAEALGDDFSVPISPLDIFSAYRVVKLRYLSDAVLAERVRDLQIGLALVNGVGDSAGLEAAGLSGYQFLMFELELDAAEKAQIDIGIFNSTAGPFFETDPDTGESAENDAFNFISQLFVDDGAAVTRARTRNATFGGITTSTSVPGRALFWGDRALQAAIDEAVEDGRVDRTVLARIWDDVAYSHRLGSDWVFRTQFNGGRDYEDVLRSEQPPFISESDIRSLGIAQFAEIFATGPDGVNPLRLLDGTFVDENHPGVITPLDIDRFSAFMLVRQLAPENTELLSGDSDQTVQVKDVEDFLDEYTTLVGLGENVTAAEAQRFLDAAVRLELIDDVFDLNDVKSLLEFFGIVLTGTALLVGTGGTAGTIFLAAAAVSEGTAVVISFSQGEVVDAAVGTFFLFFDAAELLKVARAFEPAGLAARSLVRNTDTLVDEGVVTILRSQATDAGKNVDLRVPGVTGSPEADYAFFEETVRPQMFLDLRAQGASPPQADALLNNYFDDLANGLADPAKADEFAEIFAANDAATESYARWGDKIFDTNGNLVEELVDAGRVCVARANSFSGDTLVVLANGERIPIAEVQAEDEVLAWDLEKDEAVGRPVVATLPHSDWLLEAHLSDGSVMSVTEDHRFWSVTDTAWVELQDLGADDVLLSPEGAKATFEYIDWTAGSEVPAWDLTVEEHHNFFVAADTDSEAVLVHNQDETAYFCSVKVPFDIAPALARIANGLDAGQTTALKGVLNGVNEIQQAKFLRILASADPSIGERIASNAAFAPEVARRALREPSDQFATTVLSGRRFQQTVSAAPPNVTNSLVSQIRFTTNGLSEAERSVLARVLFDTERGEIAVEYLARTGEQQEFLAGFAKAERGDNSATASEIRAWHQGTAKSPSAWDYAERMRNGYRWRPSVILGGQGAWSKAALTQFTKAEVDIAKETIENARVNGGRIPVTVENVAPITGYGARLDGFSPNQIGREGEKFTEGTKVAPDVLAQQRLTVTLKDGREFEVRPDFLDSLGVSGTKLQVAYPEAKASRVSRPTVESLSDNQAMMIAAILDDNIASIRPAIAGSPLDLAFKAQDGLDTIEVTELRLISILLQR